MNHKKSLAAVLLGFGLVAGTVKILNNRNYDAEIVDAPINYNIRDPLNKPNYKTEDFSQDSDKVLLARMIFGEGRGCSDLEKAAIGYTALTRANDRHKFNGTSVRQSILLPNQYKCFKEGNNNLNKLKDPMSYEPEAFKKCLEIAEGILEGRINNPAAGATHFALDSEKPSWKYKIDKIGKIETEKGPSKHEFYREN